MDRSVRHIAAAAVAAVAAAALLAGCTGGDDGAADGPQYVALGDSSVAGVGINTSTGGACMRSDHNYPSLVAKALKVKDFVDESCPGATTKDVLKGLNRDDGVKLPPQVEAVTADTDVVTISIGGNDRQFIPALFLSCYIPPQSSAVGCKKVSELAPSAVPKIKANIIAVLKEIQRRAPRAQVVMVSYLRLMPDSGTCDPKTVPISSADLARSAQVEARLAATMKAATQEAGADYVDMRTRSEGHDACAGEEDAWVSGIAPAEGDGTQLHPRAVGMEAVARAVEPVVADRLSQ